MTTTPHKGRGAVSTPHSRFAKQTTQFDDDEIDQRSAARPDTVLHAMPAGRIVSSNDSPDIPFDLSINPYQGCEHGCVYCYARPSHSYLDLSPGLDFETQIFYKPNAAERLLDAWQKPGYECKPITIGANTDPYQPAEKTLKITRTLLQLFRDYQHPVNIITKGNLIRRDIDILSDLAKHELCSVAISIPTMNSALKRVMEPRVPSAHSRLQAAESLAGAGVPLSLLLAPVIPAINDNEIEDILESASAAGFTRAHYVFLRLPHELKTIFADWLAVHYPDRRNHVMSLIRQASGGQLYDHRFGRRQSGRGPYAAMRAARFERAAKARAQPTGSYQQGLDCTRFLHPARRQLALDF